MAADEEDEDVISPVAASLTEGDLRLVDGGRDNQGRIEIYFNDTWWRLCKHHFNERAFTSVCRTLGLPDPEWEFRDSEFGRGNYSYLPRDFECDSEDTPLLKCRDEGYHDHHCSEEATVGVSCGELVHLECDGGSNRTDMFGTLHFMKGSKPQERRCEWIIGNEGDPKGDHIIINTYVEKGAKCGTHVNIKRFPDDHIHHSDVCRERTTQIIEFEASKVVVEIDQHHIDDVSFDGAYVFLQGSYESAQHVSGWDVSVTNITEDSLRIEWTVLTSEIDQPVEVYVVIDCDVIHFIPVATWADSLP
ncbi:neurotrypsin-like [Stylophora pistillata]|uniref:neurotrypsin-like n=1 Tax=Stylophora pistillata TaxID=50429 RepID=UPI000C0550EA|nr:neurotrypsin-like [Stylophora pistillata]